MFNTQVADLQASTLEVENKLRDTIFGNKRIEELLRSAITDGQNMRDEYKQRTRMGR